MNDNSNTTKMAISSQGRNILGAILVIGLLVRLIVAYVQPAFIDEGYLYHSTKAGLASVIHYLRCDVHPPLYNVIMYPLIVRTHNFFLLRLPNVILSLGTLFLSYFLARRFCSEKLSLALTAFLAVSYGVYITDAQLRTYCPITFCLVALWVGMLDIEKDGAPFTVLNWPSRWRWVIWGATALLGASLHTQVAMSLGACALVALTMSKKRWQTIAILCFSALPVTIWFVYNRLTVVFPTAKPIGERSALSNCLMFLHSSTAIANWDFEKWNYLVQDPALSSMTGALFFYVVSLLALAVWYMFFRGWYMLRKTHRWEADLLGINALFVPLFICVAACLQLVNYTQQRYAIPLSLPFLILMFQGLSLASRKQVAIALIAPALAVSIIFPFYKPLWNQNWQSTVDYIDRIKSPRDIVVINADSLAAFSFALAYDPENITFTFTDDYYCQMHQSPTPDKPPYALISSTMLDNSLLHDLRGYRVILVISQINDINNGLTDWFDTYYTVKDSFFQDSMSEWAKVRVFVLERKL